MITISPATLRRLRKIKQNPVVWEGAICTVPVRRQKFANVIPLLAETGDEPQYVLWADATSGIIRLMSVVEPNAGSEVLVRYLLQAIERPQGNAPPLRPQKIIVNDRESQFYLRGVLQELDIAVDFAESLPLIEEILYTLGEQSENIPEPVPFAVAPNLYLQAGALWNLAPWEYLNDYHVIEIKLDRWDIKSFYLTFMGRMGLEFGVIFYHSLESIEKFRRCAAQEMDESMADAFLSQDCIFMMFNRSDEVPEGIKQMCHSFGWKTTSHYPYFGVLHPLEGDRNFLQEEEVLALTASLEALVLFFSDHKKHFRADTFPDLKASYVPTSVPEPSPLEIVTLVEASKHILSLSEEDDEDEGLVKRYLIPDNSLLRLTFVDQETLEGLASCAQYRVTIDAKKKTKSQPIVLIQNSKPQIMELIKNLQQEEGLEGISFVPMDESGELGLLVTRNGNFHLFEELYWEDESSRIFRRWKQSCQQSGYCVVILAMGIRGKTRGHPKPNHILAYFEIEYISAEKLGARVLDQYGFEPF